MRKTVAGVATTYLVDNRNSAEYVQVLLESINTGGTVAAFVAERMLKVNSWEHLDGAQLLNLKGYLDVAHGTADRPPGPTPGGRIRRRV